MMARVIHGSSPYVLKVLEFSKHLIKVLGLGGNNKNWPDSIRHGILMVPNIGMVQQILR